MDSGVLNVICSTKSLPPDAQQEAIRLALLENPRNATRSAGHLPAGGAIPTNDTPDVHRSALPDNGDPVALALNVGKLWAPGRTLTIAFLDGTDFQKNKVKKYAPEWTRYANLKFEFVEQQRANIRIAFDPYDGSWSYIGTDNLNIASDKATMNLGWIIESRNGGNEKSIRRVILHEFGHAIGSIHEHQSPKSTIKWNTDNVYASYGGPPNNWSKKKIDANILNVYPEDDVSINATDFDSSSIMLYSYPATLTLDGKGTPLNEKLSETDKAHIKANYPAAPTDVGNFSTMEVRPWKSTERHENTAEKAFEPAYSVAPRIALGLTWIDVDHRYNIRVKATATEIRNDYFLPTISSWDDTRLYSSACSWLVVGPEADTIQTGEFSTREVQGQSGPVTKKRIVFDTRFEGDQPPTVVVWLSALDLDKKTNWRVKAYATEVTVRGFTIHIESWSDTILYSANATWLAYASDSQGICSGKFSTMDVRPWNEPRHENSGEITFAKKFEQVPQVVMALSELDYQCENNMRVRLSSKTVTTTGFTWSLDSWADSVMYSSGAMYIAIASK